MNERCLALCAALSVTISARYSYRLLDDFALCRSISHFLSNYTVRVVSPEFSPCRAMIAQSLADEVWPLAWRFRFAQPSLLFSIFYFLLSTFYSWHHPAWRHSTWKMTCRSKSREVLWRALILVGAGLTTGSVGWSCVRVGRFRCRFEHGVGA